MKQTEGDGWSQKKLATICRWMTCHAFPAWHKGGGHRGQTVEKRQQKKQTKDYVVPVALKKAYG
jgi:hypothetical protein